MLDIEKLVQDIAGEILEENDISYVSDEKDGKKDFLILMDAILSKAHASYQISETEFGEALRQMPEMLHQPTEKDLLIAGLFRAFYRCVAERVWTLIKSTA